MPDKLRNRFFRARLRFSPDEKTNRTLTVDCPAGTAAGCSVTALNKQHTTTTISLNASMYSLGVVALPTVASAAGLLYNGIPIPTSSASTTSSSNITSTSSYSSYATGTGGTYGNSTGTKVSTTKGGSSSTSSPSPVTTKSGALSQYLGAQAVFALLVGMCVVILGW
jgi:hypothetical protein